MRATELRYGNFVYDEYPDGTKYLTQVDIDQMEYPHNCKPVPLTEEWLVKLGFEEFVSPIDDIFGFRLKSFIWINEGQIRMMDGFGEYKETCILPLIEDMFNSVHRLQNLYFDLTNEELTLKDRIEPTD